VGMRRESKPSVGAQWGISALLIFIDLAVVACLLFRYSITGWADGWDPVNPPEAPGEATRAMWILVAGAVLTGGALVVRRWSAPGVVQFVVLGLGAAIFRYLAVRG
jgi:hypothetical protein